MLVPLQSFGAQVAVALIAAVVFGSGCTAMNNSSQGTVAATLDAWIQLDEENPIPAVWTEANVHAIPVTGGCSEKGEVLRLSVDEQSFRTSMTCTTSRRFDKTIDFSTLDDGAYTLTLAYVLEELADATLSVPGAFHKITMPPAPLVAEDSIAPPAFNPEADSCTIHVLAGEATDTSGAPMTFYYSAGSTAGDTDLLDWMSNGTEQLIAIPCEDFSGTVFINLYGQDLAGQTTDVITLDPIVVDTIAPDFPDGAVVTLSSASSTSATTSPTATWPAATDDASGSGILGYEIALGSSAVTQDVRDWTSVGTLTTGLFDDLSLTSSGTYTFFVRAVDGAGNPTTTTLSANFTVTLPSGGGGGGGSTPTQLHLSGSAGTTAGECSTAFTVTLLDANDAAASPSSTLTVNLAGAGTDGFFYTDSACITAVSGLTIATSSTSGTFYLKNPNVGDLTVAASASGLTGDSIAHEILLGGLLVSASTGHRVFPSSPLDQDATLSIDYSNSVSGTATDSGMTYSCSFDRIPNGTLVSGSACTNLPGSASFNTATGVLSWSPNPVAWGVYEVVVTGTNSLGSMSLARTIHVRELFETDDLVANYDALFFNRLSSPDLAIEPLLWKDLTSNSQHATVPAGSWGGTGSFDPWHLELNGEDTVTLPIGTNNSGMTAFSFGMWLRPNAPNALGSVILGNGGGSGQGFVLRQGNAGTTAGKIELQIGDGDNVESVDDLDPLHFWRFDDAAAIKDEFSNVSGTKTSGVTLGATGATSDSNTAADFDGSGLINLNGITDLPMGNAARSVCFWAKPTSTAGVRWVFEYGVRDNSKLMTIGVVNGAAYFAGFNSDLSHPGFWEVGVWKHLCGVYDGTTAYLYGNGTLLTSGARTWNTVSSGSVRIGSSINDNEFWAGSIDELGFFDRALTSSEISALYQATSFHDSCRSVYSFDPNRLTHIGGTFDGSQLKLFIDGEEECSMPVTSGLAPPTSDLTLGGRSDGSDAWTGDVIDLKFYSAADPTYVSSHYSATRNRAENDADCYGTRLAASPFATASTGSVSDPHIVCSTAQLQAIDDDSAKLSANYKLGRRLDFGGAAHTPIGNSSSPFVGSFEGMGRSVGRFTISGSSYLGLFGKIGTGGMVSNLIVSDISVTSTDAYVGGIAGFSSGTLYRVGVAGTSTIRSSTVSQIMGGIVGQLEKPGIVDESFVGSGVSVQGTHSWGWGSYAGGIAGYLYGTNTGSPDQFPEIRNSYSLAQVFGGSDHYAGIAGRVDGGKLTHNYFAGVVNNSNNVNEGGIVGEIAGAASIFTGNVYDSTVCAAANSRCSTAQPSGVSALFTSLARSLTTYVAQGWDFNDVWTMPGHASSGQYPVLQWQAGQSAFPTPPTPANTLTYSGGNGSAGSPFLISNTSDFYAFLTDKTRWSTSTHFQLTGDLNLSGNPIPSAGTPNDPFVATFDGQGHTLSNFTVAGLSYVGLFGYIGDDGEVSNLIVSDISVTGSGSYVGGVAGRSSGTLYRVGVAGTSTIRNNSYYQHLGGIVGQLEKPGLVDESFVGSGVSVQGTHGWGWGLFLGGIAGSLYGTNSGEIGLFPEIRNSYSLAQVFGGSEQTGGIAGQVIGGKLTHNYFAGINNNGNNVNEGGIAGEISGATSIFTGNVYDSTVCAAANNRCSTASPPGVSALFTSLAKSLTSYVGQGWDFEDVWTMPGHASSGQYPVLQWQAGQSAFPTPPTPANTLTYSGGNGSAGSPFLISTTSDFYAFLTDKARWSTSTHFRLTGNLNLSGNQISSAGTPNDPFVATFDGQSHTVSNFTVAGLSYVGLFGYIGNEGEVSNLIISDISVTGSGIYVGGVAGRSSGTLYRVGVAGTSTIRNNTYYQHLGGIVGQLEMPGVVDESFVGSGVSVQGTHGWGWGLYLGGIAGSLYGTNTGVTGYFPEIRNSYSLAQVFGGSDHSGGIAGQVIGGKLTHNYFAGINNNGNNVNEGGIAGEVIAAASVFTGNYYDSTVCAAASGHCSSSQPTGVTALSTSDMQNSANFSGWDFSTIWEAPGSAYFNLLWEP